MRDEEGNEIRGEVCVANKQIHIQRYLVREFKESAKEHVFAACAICRLLMKAEQIYNIQKVIP